jgi:hypothetical protein
VSFPASAPEFDAAVAGRSHGLAPA